MKTMPVLSKFSFTVPVDRSKEIFEQLEKRYLAQTSEFETLAFEGIITIPNVGLITSIHVEYPDPDSCFDTIGSFSRIVHHCTISITFMQGYP